MVYEGANIEEDALVDGETSDEEDDDGYYLELPQLGEGFESMYNITEKSLTGRIEGEEGIISPGSRTICHAMATISRKES